jgi:hypothetical protein
LVFVNAGAELFNGAGEFATRNERERIGRNTVRAFPQSEIGAVQRRRFDFDQNLVGFGFRHRDVLVLENLFGRAEFMDANGFHGFRLL